ncbi:MAG: amino acid ABC transporter permease [Defluviitaleaceae bacterium]|nr:amino acid ABC transporter permease [Defluviitaleaceae bacterium]
MNLNVDYMISIIPLMTSAATYTIKITVLGVFFSFLIGIAGNIVYYYKIPFLSGFFKGYTEISRNTPIIAQLFFLFFGLPQVGITLSGFVCGVIALSFLGGSYMVEALRSGIESVSKIQKESGFALALSKTQILVYIILPQALRTSLQGLFANVIFLLRESSLIGAIAVPELMHVARSEISMFFRTEEVLLMLTFYYIILIAPISIFFTFLEKRLRYAR